MVTEIREIRPKIAVEKVLEDRAVIAKEVREELEVARRMKEKNDLLEEGTIHTLYYECDCDCFSPATDVVVTAATLAFSHV